MIDSVLGYFEESNIVYILSLSPAEMQFLSVFFVESSVIILLFNDKNV